MGRYSKSQHRYCVILAGGDGERLRQLTQCVSADARPKQFCPFLKGWTPLRATMHRAARGFDPARTLFVVTRAHESYYTEELADVRPCQVLVQPENKGTAPAILLTLSYLNRIDPEASVVFLPSDHHYGDEPGFLDAVHRAFEAGDERTEPAILLGASPTHPEVGYGWIEPGPATAGRSGLFRVMRFWESSVSQDVAQFPTGGYLGIFAVTSGTWILTGSGGPDVGAFIAKTDLPQDLVWTNAGNFSTVPRSDVTITWTGGNLNANSLVTIAGSNVAINAADPSQSRGKQFFCNAPATAGKFVIPAAILSQLPASTSNSVGMLGVNAGGGSPFTAPLTAGGSIDAGLLSYGEANTLSVKYQ